MTIRPYPATRVARVRVGALRCAGCDGAAPFIFVLPDPGAPRVDAYCSPHCAADAGIAPWAGAGTAERARWPAAVPAIAVTA